MTDNITMEGAYTTRKGWPARVLAIDLKGGTNPVVAAVTYPDGREMLLYYPANGRYLNGRESDYDLIPAPPRITGWVNVYHASSKAYYLGSFHKTEEEAKTRGEYAVARIHVDVTEGDGL